MKTKIGLSLVSALLAAQLVGCRPATPAPTQVLATETPGVGQTVEATPTAQLTEQIFNETRPIVQECEITSDYLELEELERDLLAENGVDACEAIPYLEDGWTLGAIVNLTKNNISAEEAKEFAIFEQPAQIGVGRIRMFSYDIQNLLAAGFTAESVEPYYSKGVSILCLASAALSGTPIDQAEYLVSRGVSGCSFDFLFEKYTFEELVDWLDLLEDNGSVLEDLIFMYDPDFDLVKQLREGGANPADVSSLIAGIYDELITLSEALEYVNNEIPSYVIYDHKTRYSEYSIEEIAPYFNRFWNYIRSNMPYANDIIFGLIGYPLEEIQQAVDIGVLPSQIRSVIDEDILSMEGVDPLVSYGYYNEIEGYVYDDLTEYITTFNRNSLTPDNLRTVKNMMECSPFYAEFLYNALNANFSYNEFICVFNHSQNPRLIDNMIALNIAKNQIMQAMNSEDCMEQ